MTLRPVRSGPLGLLLALALIPATGHATGPPDATSTSAYRGRRVLLVTPEPGGDIAPAVLTRLRGELRAARFEMDVATIATDAPRRATVEEMATREGTSAALGIFFGSGRVEMWASDASAGRTLMQNLPLDQGTPDRRATIVAVKAVDLLKATLAEIWSAPPPSPPVSEPPTPEPVIVAPPPPAMVIEHPEEEETNPGRADRFSLSAGAGWLGAGSVSGWAPVISISTALGHSGLAARLTMSALGSSTDIARTEGSAQLTQQIALAELLLWSRAWHTLRGALAIGAGLHHLSIDGQGAQGFSSGNQSLWSTATGAGGSVAWNLHPNLMLALDARAVENWPATTVNLHGVQIARVGRPIIWVALAAGVRFR
jgi:hypothetical protein